MKKILVVDDQEINIEILSQVFSKEYTVLTATNGEKALEIIQKEKLNICAVLLDIVMPKMDGIAVLQKIKEMKLLRFIPVIMITGDRNPAVEQKMLADGASEFISKPFSPHIVYHRVQNVIDLYQYKTQLERMLMQQTKKVEQQAKKLEQINGKLLDTLGNIVEFRDLESGEHVKRIKTFTYILGKSVMENYPEYNLTPEKLEVITAAAILHDVGKIVIPDNILNKPGRLTNDEFDIMKTHTTKGSEIIKRLEFLDDLEFSTYCYEISRHHHEKYDGKGYPDGLTGDDIPISAQIVSIADVYDALVSERVYKESYTPQKAYEMILQGECGIFNPKLLDCFKKVKQQFEENVSNTR